MASLHCLAPETTSVMGEVHQSQAFVLYYLPLRARAEPIRMILHYGGVNYQDVTIPMTEWPSLKERRCIAPFGQLPSIRLPGGEIIAQSGSIARYAAKLANVYPTDPLAAARADMIFEYAQELNMINPLLNFWPMETDTWANNYKVFFDNLPRHLGTLSTMLGQKFFFCGQSPNHGDFAIFHVLDACVTMRPYCINDYPSLLNFMERIRSFPSIRAYLENRPPAQEVGLCGSYIQREIGRVKHHD
jgi:glutathione S-transferase